MDKLTNRHVFKKNMIVLSLSLALTACDLTDADDDSLTISATTKPAWLSFGAATGILSGTAVESDEGDSAVVLSVTDGTDEVTQSFDITVTVPVPENNASVIPVLVLPILPLVKPILIL